MVFLLIILGICTLLTPVTNVSARFFHLDLCRRSQEVALLAA
jgi:hypothetical protein